jgi:hypothetical protein
MELLGTITETRVHPTRPVRVQVSFEGEETDLGWLQVSVSAWATVNPQKIVSLEVSVLDTGFDRHGDQYRVTAFWPSEDHPLPVNEHPLARAGDVVQIHGSPKVTPAIAAVLGGLPTLPLGHDLTGEILGVDGTES